jgi:hypothetical protein
MPDPKHPDEISALLHEERVFTPPESFACQGRHP